MLHNQDFIDQREIAVGDIITVRKAGEIIPEVVAVAEHKGENPVFQIPRVCPSWRGRAVGRDKEAAVLRCENVSCPAQVLRNLILSPPGTPWTLRAWARPCWRPSSSREMIASPADLYHLKQEEVAAIDRMGEKSAANLMAAIDRSRGNDLGRVIFALGIRGSASGAPSSSPSTLGQWTPSWPPMWKRSMPSTGLGRLWPKAWWNFFAGENNRLQVQRLKDAGVNMTCLNKPQSKVLEGLVFVLTGTLPTMSRNEAKEIIENLGGRSPQRLQKNQLCSGRGRKLEAN